MACHPTLLVCFAAVVIIVDSQNVDNQTTQVRVEFLSEASLSTAAVACHRYENGACGLVLGATDYASCFSSLEACESSHPMTHYGCYQYHNGACNLILGAPASSCFSSQERCDMAHPTCYENEGGMCIQMHRAPDGNHCFSSRAECERPTCYENEGGMCIQMRRAPDGNQCFSSRAECERPHHHTCYENEGGMCIQMHRSPDGSRCFATHAECDRPRRLDSQEANSSAAKTQSESLASAIDLASASCYRYQNRACGLVFGATDYSSCFPSQEQCEMAHPQTHSGCYQYHNGACSLMLGAPPSSCFPSQERCERAHPTCYESEGGMCIQMRRQADGFRCLATKSECETCYENEGGMCIQMHKAPDANRCFASHAECNRPRRLADIHV